jgi:hypothetical protein
VPEKEMKLYFEPYQLLEFYKLYDKAERRNGNKQMLDSFKLWSFVHKCFPKVDLAAGHWEIDFDSIFNPYIMEEAV